MFVIYYNILTAPLRGRYARAIRRQAMWTLFQYPAERINLRILKHYGYRPSAVGLLTLSYILRLPLYYVAFLKRTLTRIRVGDRGVFKEIAGKVRKRGLTGILFPFRHRS
jgi:hypothetical protein